MKRMGNKNLILDELEMIAFVVFNILFLSYRQKGNMMLQFFEIRDRGIRKNDKGAACKKLYYKLNSRAFSFYGIAIIYITALCIDCTSLVSISLATLKTFFSLWLQYPHL